ncbi:uncharacterized protein LOC120256302 isoform X1 [Dioscorea cayenensis subsp. rotundata]|uniref:Uncharacterized protein LOC120256302 isoform X1 n=1 Tax=Dioscorea cayennensis subsp. rotundata TaxID=55577 RepID=A0AB40AY12_DIOCR|nr:uncharacterized protein LOC120256302 isoform X1 [Dioscorea cayenensis subsp. rotundata]XP_039119943.1 uncharacterized protein LOC120256302 isoform X1 [Dioscorea cayenensis subsp. rotundata]
MKSTFNIHEDNLGNLRNREAIVRNQEVRMPEAGSKGAPKYPSELKDDTSASCEKKKDRLHSTRAEIGKWFYLYKEQQKFRIDGEVFYTKLASTMNCKNYEKQNCANARQRSKC